MKENKREDLKSAGKGFTIDSILNAGSSAAGNVAKDSISSMVGDIIVDSASSLVPVVSGAVQGYKRARFERNIVVFTEELYAKIEEVNMNMEEKTDNQKEKIDQLLAFIMDYVIDEQQDEKIAYMVNGFVNVTQHEQISDDFLLTYYDVLKELRMVDIAVLKLMYSSRYVLDHANRESYQDVMERHGLSYEQYEAVRRNLHRIGVLTTRTDLNIYSDLEEISKRFKELYSYLEKLTNPKHKRSLPKLKEPKLKSKDNFEVSKFGRDFVNFFLDLD